jgi:hypothetical protein
VPGRGYRLAVPISRSNAPDAGHVERTASSQLQALPARLTRMVGPEENIQKIAEELSARRFVSIVGPGGIGAEVGHTLPAAELAKTYCHTWFTLPRRAVSKWTCAYG